MVDKSHDARRRPLERPRSSSRCPGEALSRQRRSPAFHHAGRATLSVRVRRRARHGGGGAVQSGCLNHLLRTPSSSRRRRDDPVGPTNGRGGVESGERHGTAYRGNDAAAVEPFHAFDSPSLLGVAIRPSRRRVGSRVRRRREHGGHVTGESQIGRGSTSLITMPATRPLREQRSDRW